MRWSADKADANRNKKLLANMESHFFPAKVHPGSWSPLLIFMPNGINKGGVTEGRDGRRGLIIVTGISPIFSAV